MDAGLTAAFDPLLLASQDKRLSGKLALRYLSRLAALSSKPSSGWIEVDLQFNCDERQKYWIHGNISTRINVICQRCLEQMSLSLRSEVHILLVGNNANNHETVDQEQDIIVCKGKMTVADLIEDELLLAMPMFPMHQANSCQNKKISIKSIQTTKHQKEDLREGPFAVLATLKSDKKPGKKSGKKKD